MSGYTDPRWMTYKQAADAGGTVRKGEHGTLIVFWRIVEGDIDPVTGKRTTRPILRTYTVFNVEQCDELDARKLSAFDAVADTDGWDSIAEAEAIIDGYTGRPGPMLDNGGNGRAFYQPLTDSIRIPKRAQFEVAGEYYSTVFHELGHSTGHKDRLNRFGENYTSHFGDEAYSKEELVAEFASAFLCATAGIDNTLENSTAYIAGWNMKFREDTRVIIYAAAQASKAAALVAAATSAEDEEVEAA